MLLDEFYKYISTGDRDTDNILVSAAHVERHQDVQAYHLYKVWIVGIDQSKETLCITTQKSVKTNNPKLSRNYVTNYHMLPYKRINEYLYMHNFFATKNPRKSTKQNISCKIFVTDIVFVYVVPMKSDSYATIQKDK